MRMLQRNLLDALRVTNALAAATLLLAAGVLSCGRDELATGASAGSGASPATASSIAEGDLGASLVVMRTGVQPCSSFFFSLGPAIMTGDTLVRPYSIATSAPHVSIVQRMTGTVRALGGNEVGYEKGLVKVTIRPVEGKAWKDVGTENDLKYEGLDVIVFDYSAKR
jgi:hypothetical protein